MGCSSAAAAIEFIELTLEFLWAASIFLTWALKRQDAESMGKSADSFKAVILPCEWYATLPNSKHHHVDEGLLVQCVGAALLACVESDFIIKLS